MQYRRRIFSIIRVACSVCIVCGWIVGVRGRLECKRRRGFNWMSIFEPEPNVCARLAEIHGHALKQQFATGGQRLRRRRRWSRLLRPRETVRVGGLDHRRGVGGVSRSQHVSALRRVGHGTDDRRACGSAERSNCRQANCPKIQRFLGRALSAFGNEGGSVVVISYCSLICHLA